MNLDEKDEDLQSSRGGMDHKGAQYLKREIHFTVESPTNDQIPIRYKPDMSVNAVYIHACKKFGINPDEHYITFNNKEMNLGKTMRKYTISSNSVLKIYRGGSASAKPDVFVSIRIRDCRIGSVFRQTDDLWNILNKLISPSSYEEDLVPIVIYKKNEFIGSTILKEVRLRDIGVTSGTCILRFLQLKQDDLDQRRTREEDETAGTLESLEMAATGPTTDAGLRSVHFKVSEDNLDTENVQYIGERKALAFRLEDQESWEEQIQVIFFDLMLEEVTVLMNEVCKKNGILNKAEAVPIVIAELNKVQQMRSDCEDTMIRVMFPDKTCLQCLFQPDERVGDLRDFMKKFLKSPDQEFELMSKSPDVVLDDSFSFKSLKMIPIGRIYFREIEPAESGPQQSLADDVYMNMVPMNVGIDAGMMLRGESLDRFMTEDQGRTSSFFSKFTKRGPSTSRSSKLPMGKKSMMYGMSKNSSFQPRKRSKGSASMSQPFDGDDDEDEVEVKAPQAQQSQVVHQPTGHRRSLVKAKGPRSSISQEKRTASVMFAAGKDKQEDNDDDKD